MDILTVFQNKQKNSYSITLRKTFCSTVFYVSIMCYKNVLLTLINRFAFVKSPSVVCLEASAPNGTISFNRSKQLRRWARLKIIKTNKSRL